VGNYLILLVDFYLLLIYIILLLFDNDLFNNI